MLIHLLFSDNRKAELESSLKEDRGFFSNCDSIQEWLRGIQLSLAPDLKISADTDILHQQVTEFEVRHFCMQSLVSIQCEHCKVHYGLCLDSGASSCGSLLIVDLIRFCVTTIIADKRKCVTRDVCIKIGY